LYDGSIHSGLSSMLSKNCFLNPSDKSLNLFLLVGGLNAFSTISINSFTPIFFVDLWLASPLVVASTFSPLMMEGEIQIFRMVCRRDLVLSKLLMIAAKKACRTLDIAAMNGCMTSSVDTYRRIM
jgi:hypothetical protein